MSYQKIPQEDYPPPGYGAVYPPPAYPSAPPQPQAPPSGYTYSYPPPRPSGYPYNQQQQGYQGYFNQGYPTPAQVYHCDHQHHDNGSGDCTSFLRGCFAALCCCCVLEECCF